MNYISEHPFIMSISAISTGVIGFLQVLTPLLSFVSVLLGVAIGIYTLKIKIHDWKKKNNDRTY